MKGASEKRLLLKPKRREAGWQLQIGWGGGHGSF